MTIAPIARPMSAIGLPYWMVLGAAVLAGVLFFYSYVNQSPRPVYDESLKINECELASLAKMAPKQIDIGLLTSVSSYCYNKVRGEDLLRDFSLRRQSFVEQIAAGAIVLWMVVTITVSGVILAGLQLLAAYRLADSGRGQLGDSNEFSLARDKISLRSSVTGLLILTVSFAFFLVYVLWVYTITNERIGNAPEISAGEPGPQTQLDFGGLGAPPADSAVIEKP